MQEVKGTDINEIKKPEPEEYKNIKPENGITGKECRGFWENEFKKEAEYYNDYEDRLGCTPKEDSHLGTWEGDRGESKFLPNSETVEGKAALDKLNEKGMDGIEYKNAEPDFSKCAEATVRIDDMTQNRDDYIGADGTIKQGNFTQADIKCSEKWNAEARDGKSDWTARDVYNWRHENKCSWHERCDRRTMDLVPFEIHSHCKHLGGVSECKVRDAVNVGGEFDE